MKNIYTETLSGRVSGAVVDGVHIFRGIPYGGPAAGANRWLPPTKPVPWAGVHDGTVNGP
ncbi:MAG: carboxylesterase family protein, partial [Anaerolineae bacterium]